MASARFEITDDFRPDVARLATEILKELGGALATHGNFASAHEGYAVLLEEVDELKLEVWKKRAKRSEPRMRAECIQIAAMAMKFALNLCKEEVPDGSKAGKPVAPSTRRRSRSRMTNGAAAGRESPRRHARRGAARPDIHDFRCEADPGPEEAEWWS